MVNIKGKQYKTIIWDWRSTLYDPLNHELYDWVKPFFEENKDLEHILVSYVSDREKRMKWIKDTGMKHQFKHIFLTSSPKRQSFEEIVDGLGYNPEEIIVVGDNENDEIKAAQDLALDSILVEDFVKEVLAK